MLPDWLAGACRYVQDHIPRDFDGDWDHAFCSAYQMGCDLLGAAGLAQETGRGARPLPVPQVPDLLPRRDDTCIVILKMARQTGGLEFLPWPIGGQVLDLAFGQAPLQTVIAASPWAGPAFATQAVIEVLERLGLLEAGRWTRKVEPLLWRVWPYLSTEPITSSARVIAAIRDAQSGMPPAIRAEILQAVGFTPERVASAGTGALQLSRTEAAEMLRPTDVRRFKAQWVFYTSWRLDDGWLIDHHAGRPLEIFNDCLADIVCEGVLTQMFGLGGK